LKIENNNKRFHEIILKTLVELESGDSNSITREENAATEDGFIDCRLG
jgi:hypothetical protein